MPTVLRVRKGVKVAEGRRADLPEDLSVRVALIQTRRAARPSQGTWGVSRSGALPRRMLAASASWPSDPDVIRALASQTSLR